MKKFNFTFGAAALMILAFAFGASAQAIKKEASTITVEFIEFQSTVDYTTVGGSAPRNLDYAKFDEKMRSEIKTGATKIINRNSAKVVLGTETSFKVGGRLTISPQLVGGYTDETSNLVDAQIDYRNEMSTEDVRRGQKPPESGLRAFSSNVTLGLDKISVIGGGYGNPNGTFTYAAVRFIR